MAPGARIWAIRVGNENGVIPTSAALCGMEWVAKNARRIDVVNLSFGGEGADTGNCGRKRPGVPRDSFHQAICRVIKMGVTVVAAAGNEASDVAGFTPAAYPELITVSAFTETDGLPGGFGGSPWCMPESEFDHRLGGVGRLIPNPHLLIGPHRRLEAVLSSRIEATKTDVGQLLLFEAGQAPSREAADDATEVANYVVAMEHGLARVRDGFPVSVRLFQEMHERLLRGVRGQHRRPGELRTSPVWIGGATLEDAVFVPPPPEEMQRALGDLERFLHESHLALLVQLAVAHYQFEVIRPWVAFFLRGVRRQARDSEERTVRLVELQFRLRNELLEEGRPNSVVRLAEQLFAIPVPGTPAGRGPLLESPSAKFGGLESLRAACGTQRLQSAGSGTLVLQQPLGHHNLDDLPAEQIPEGVHAREDVLVHIEGGAGAGVVEADGRPGR